MSTNDPQSETPSTVDLGNYAAGQSTYTISSGSGVDTITLDPAWTNMSITLPSTYTTTLGSGNYTIGTTSSWNYSNVNITGNGIDMADGTDIRINGKSLKDFMDKMEERLAILVPDPAKLEKFEALRKAYEHYKLMEKLCQEPKEEN